MYDPEHLDTYVSPQALSQRRNTAYESIWSTNGARDQRQFSLDLGSANTNESPGKPPSTPLPQGLPGKSLSFDNSLHLCSSAQLRDPFATGLGVLNPSLAGAGNNFNGGDSQWFETSFCNHPPPQIRGQVLTFQNEVQPPPGFQNYPGSPGLYTPGATNYASQNVLPLTEQLPPSSPFVNFNGSAAGANRRFTNQPTSLAAADFPFRSGSASSLYAGSPYPENLRAGKNDQIDLSPTEKYNRVPLSIDTAAHENYVAHQSQSHARRHSCGDPARAKDGNRYDSLETSRLYARVNPYFTRDPHEKIRITYSVITTCLKKEAEYLDAKYGNPQFVLDDYLVESVLVLVAFKAGRLDVFYIPKDSPELFLIQEGAFVIVEADRGRDLGKLVKMGISWDEARVLRLLDNLQQQVNFGERFCKDLLLSQVHPSQTMQNEHRSSVGSFGSVLALISPKAVIAVASLGEIGLILRKSQDEEKAMRTSLSKIVDTLASTRNLKKVVERTKSTSSCGQKTGSMASPKSFSTSSPEDLRSMRFVDFEYQFDRKKLTIDYTAPRRVDFRDLVRELFLIFKTRIWMSPVVGIPYKPSKGPNDRRHSQPIRADGIRGRASYNRERNHSRASGPQSLVNILSQSSAEYGNSIPKSYSQSSNGGFLHDHGGQSFNCESIRDRVNEMREVDLRSTVPRLLRDDSDSAESIDTEERYVTKSLVDTLNL